jgi:hypothetical protein
MSRIGAAQSVAAGRYSGSPGHDEETESMKRLRRKHLSGLFAAAALGALLAFALSGAAGAEEQVTVGVGIQLSMNGGFAPVVLSKTVPRPVALNISGHLETFDETQPPALRELVIETDKNGAIDVRGFPACNPKLQIQAAGNPEAICRRAIIGEGTARFEIDPPESPPMPFSGKLLILNGGFRDGVTTLYARVRFALPTLGPSVILSTVKIKKINNGPYGTKAIVSIPKIADGYGSVISFSATIKKQLPDKGKRFSVLTLRCPNGEIRGQAEALFSDGAKADTDVFRTCTGKG